MIIVMFFAYISIGLITALIHDWMAQGTDDDASISCIPFWPLALPLTLLEVAGHYMVSFHNDTPLKEHLREHFRADRKAR